MRKSIPLGVVVLGLALATAASADVTIRDCYFAQVGGSGDGVARAAVGLGGVLLRTRVRGNVMFTAAGVANVPSDGPANSIALLPRPLVTDRPREMDRNGAEDPLAQTGREAETRN